MHEIPANVSAAKGSFLYCIMLELLQRESQQNTVAHTVELHLSLVYYLEHYSDFLYKYSQNVSPRAWKFSSQVSHALVVTMID